MTLEEKMALLAKIEKIRFALMVSITADKLKQQNVLGKTTEEVLHILKRSE